MKNDELDRAIGTVKPVIDDLAGTAYERRPDPTSIRARAELPGQSPGLRADLAPGNASADSDPYPYPDSDSVRGRRPIRPIMTRWPVLAGAAAVLTASSVLAGAALTGAERDVRDGDP
ncbi:hypothetical protein ACFQ07_04575, partial [Actinomadura adrarensis]